METRHTVFFEALSHSVAWARELWDGVKLNILINLAQDNVLDFAVLHLGVRLSRWQLLERLDFSSRKPKTKMNSEDIVYNPLIQ